MCATALHSYRHLDANQRRTLKHRPRKWSVSVQFALTMRMKYISRQNSEIDIHSKRDEQPPP